MALPALPLPSMIRPGLNVFLDTNTIFPQIVSDVRQTFKALKPGSNVIKVFHPLIANVPIKLECFSLASLHRRGGQESTLEWSN
jgi:hypothetical protein